MVETMIGKTEAEFRRDLLLNTETLMEILEEYEKELSIYDVNSIEYEIALKMHDRSSQKFERNIKLLSVLKKVEIGK